MDKQSSQKKKYNLKKRKVYIEGDLFESEAYKALSAKAAWVLLRFLQKREWSYPGKKKSNPIYNNKGLVFTYDEANYFGISTSYFNDIIKKLVAVGFIDIEHQGGFFGRDFSRYSLSERWRDYGTPGFKKVEKKRVLQAGLDVRSWQNKKTKNATEKRSYVTTENRSYQ